jgi:hypothetical protein
MSRLRIAASVAKVYSMFRISILLLSAISLFAQTTSSPRNILNDSSIFPIAVWLQNPKNAARFKAAGVNLYVGLYRGPTAEQLATLAKSEMPVICGQTARSLAFKDNPLIVAWMHDDEPDNAQALPDRKGWGPPVLPSVIQEDYKKMLAADPTRPVFLNLGQGVAWDNWIGRGVRRNKPEDYPEYVKGGDIVSFDIYPAVHGDKEVAGKLEFVAKGVERLRDWAGPNRKVWNCIEAARISNVDIKPSADQIRSEVWMSIIHGSQGIVYFVHQFKPTFSEASLLEDPALLAGVTSLNAQVQELAPVINSATVGSKVTTSENKLKVATLLKEYRGTNYLFTVGMEDRAAEVSFQFPELLKIANVELIGEARSVRVESGEFRDHFKSYEVHLYRFKAAK